MKIRYRYDIINALINKYGYKSYLEIGVKKKANFNRIEIESKICVDPNTNCDYKMTSDSFFEQEKEITFDIVFIDGLHIKNQVLRDIDNSLQRLNENGTIVVHDCNPILKEHAMETYDKNAPIWNGTVWEAFVELRMIRDDLTMMVVDIDHGCGVIRRGKQEKYPQQKIEFGLLESDRARALNLISTEEFLETLDENFISH